MLPFRSLLSEFFGVATDIQLTTALGATSTLNGVGLRRKGVPAAGVAAVCNTSVPSGVGLRRRMDAAATGGDTGCTTGSGGAAACSRWAWLLLGITCRLEHPLGVVTALGVRRGASTPSEVRELPRQSGAISCTLPFRSRLSPFLGVARGPASQVTVECTTSSHRGGGVAVRLRREGVPQLATDEGCGTRSGAAPLRSAPRACMTLWRMLCALLGIMTRACPFKPCLSEFLGVAKHPCSEVPM
mmetsp:Transcript_30372/g.83658  ORF Transcript_30372/g.83658 Transcript_30372/m.83658 type:complete len:243 (+) Transcript_30372:252-980(+)